MDDSARLRAEVDRRAAERPVRRAPVQDVIREFAARHAAQRGLDVDEFLARVTDPELGDQLLQEADNRIRRERVARQVDILLRRLPSKFRDADFPRTHFGWEAKKWLDGYRAARAAGKPWKSLVILGSTGTGKTWTGSAIVRALLVEDMVPSTVITVADMLEQLRPAAPGSGLDVDMLQFSSAPVLMLDDLGMERLTEWGAEQLYRLADERSRNDRPVIVTSNLTGAQIKAQYDERTVQRLFGGAQLIQIAGESRRSMPF
jgi:DNA replication protein DnaC